MRTFIAGMLLAVSYAAHAIDAGTAQGTLQVGQEHIVLKHAYAQLHDNAEGLLERPELRVLLTDRVVEQNVLNGLVFLPVWHMAKQGQVRGLLLTLDPKDRTRVLATLLYPPASPTASLITQSRMDSEGVLRPFEIAPTRVSGAIAHQDSGASTFAELPPLNYQVSFSAPLFHEPDISADLRGARLKNSAQLQVLRASAAALKAGDFAAQRALSSERLGRATAALLADDPRGEMAALLKQAGQELALRLPTARRLVERGNRAVVIYADKSWNALQRVDGVWKLDD